MRAIWVSSSVLLFAILAAAWPGAGQQPTDTRQQIVLAPPARDKIGMQTHRAFDALADQLKGGATTEEAVKSLAALTGNCVACHATYRLDHAR